ncbi:unnamed protein product [Symbiodinium sp. CCMP2592]|nr:unnamed protein product [Symbiodinium sp. CCMP2592]
MAKVADTQIQRLGIKAFLKSDVLHRSAAARLLRAWAGADRELYGSIIPDNLTESSESQLLCRQRYRSGPSHAFGASTSHLLPGFAAFPACDSLEASKKGCHLVVTAMPIGSRKREE